MAPLGFTPKRGRLQHTHTRKHTHKHICKRSAPIWCQASTWDTLFVFPDVRSRRACRRSCCVCFCRLDVCSHCYLPRRPTPPPIPLLTPRHGILLDFWAQPAVHMAPLRLTNGLRVCRGGTSRRDGEPRGPRREEGGEAGEVCDRRRGRVD